jgi:diaminopimelate decarboxylase
MTPTGNLTAWGLESGPTGELVVAGCGAVDLAAQYGTPLHVVNEARLEDTARYFIAAAQSQYPGNVSVHYPFKCNAVPGVVETIRRAGLKAEVMTEFELELARYLGFRNDEIIANGPCKTAEFLRACLEARIELLIIDSLEELAALEHTANRMKRNVNVLLRVNPDYVPRGMNDGSATGSRKGCAFGLDLKGGEVFRALHLFQGLSGVTFMGFHFHVGTGIRDARDHADALSCLLSLVAQARHAGQRVRVVDVGGGIASMTTREFTSLEMLRYQAFGTLPAHIKDRKAPTFADFTRAISRAVVGAFPSGELPELIYEPGRCIASPNQFLLLTIHHVKTRAGVGTWLIADGGLSTVTLPTFYEYHEVILANDTNRPLTARGTIIGPACFAGDIIYRNKLLPAIREGEVIAVMDTGAYFTGLESSFGFYRPAIVGVAQGESHIIRSRETFSECIARDIISHCDIREECAS